MAKTWKAWTRKEEARLADLRGRGLTIERCAAELGRTFFAVKNRVLAIDAPKHSPRRIEWLHVLTSGRTERECAAVMGVSKWAVKRMKQRLKGRR